MLKKSPQASYPWASLITPTALLLLHHHQAVGKHVMQSLLLCSNAAHEKTDVEDHVGDDLAHGTARSLPPVSASLHGAPQAARNKN